MAGRCLFGVNERSVIFKDCIRYWMLQLELAANSICFHPTPLHRVIYVEIMLISYHSLPLSDGTFLNVTFVIMDVLRLTIQSAASVSSMKFYK